MMCEIISDLRKNPEDPMQQVRSRERNQITLPASIAAAANLRVDDVLEVDVVNGVITRKRLVARHVSLAQT